MYTLHIDSMNLLHRFESRQISSPVSSVEFDWQEGHLVASHPFRARADCRRMPGHVCCSQQKLHEEGEFCISRRDITASLPWAMSLSLLVPVLSFSANCPLLALAKHASFRHMSSCIKCPSQTDDQCRLHLACEITFLEMFRTDSRFEGINNIE